MSGQLFFSSSILRVGVGLGVGGGGGEVICPPVLHMQYIHQHTKETPPKVFFVNSPGWMIVTPPSCSA